MPRPAGLRRDPRRRLLHRGPRHGGALSLEAAMAVPVLFLLVLVVLHAAVLAADALLVHGAAREGARAAAAGVAESEVRAVVSEVIGGRSAQVTVAPTRRRPGEVVTVSVRLESRAGMLVGPLYVSGTAAGTVEPGGGA